MFRLKYISEYPPKNRTMDRLGGFIWKQLKQTPY